MAFDRTRCDYPSRPGAMATLDLNAIGATGPSTLPPPLRLDEVLLRWMRYHFAAASRITLEPLSGKVWTDTPDSPILIQSLAEYSPDVAQGRPAVLVAMLEQTPDPNRPIDDRRMGGCGPGAAELVYHQFHVGKHVLHCIGGKEGEANLLAFEVYREIVSFGPVVRPRLCLHRLVGLGIAPRTKLEEHQETWTVPVGLGYGYCWSSRVFPLDTPDLAGVETVITPPTE
jgi:hypothetical protein